MNIGDCPVGPKPDGYHDRPLYLGVAEDDPLVKFAGVAGQHGIAKLYRGRAGKRAPSSWRRRLLTPRALQRRKNRRTRSSSL